MVIEKVKSGKTVSESLVLAKALEIGCCNWPEEDPEAPKVEVRCVHTGNELFLRFDVEEKCTAALVDRDNGDVWTDSCVEFFVTFGTAGYYNIEANCIGRLLMSHRLSKTDGVEMATPEVLAAIKRNPSLGRETFSERLGDNRWSLDLAIPVSSFFKDDLKDFSGVECRANFYKCGDNLSLPHFLSWKRIETTYPDFHRPEFFGSLKFED